MWIACQNQTTTPVIPRARVLCWYGERAWVGSSDERYSATVGTRGLTCWRRGHHPTDVLPSEKKKKRLFNWELGFGLSASHLSGVGAWSSQASVQEHTSTVRLVVLCVLNSRSFFFFFFFFFFRRTNQIKLFKRCGSPLRSCCLLYWGRHGSLLVPPLG